MQETKQFLPEIANTCAFVWHFRKPAFPKQSPSTSGKQDHHPTRCPLTMREGNIQEAFRSDTKLHRSVNTKEDIEETKKARLNERGEGLWKLVPKSAKLSTLLRIIWCWVLNEAQYLRNHEDVRAQKDKSRLIGELLICSSRGRYSTDVAMGSVPHCTPPPHTVVLGDCPHSHCRCPCVCL